MGNRGNIRMATSKIAVVMATCLPLLGCIAPNSAGRDVSGVKVTASAPIDAAILRDQVSQHVSAEVEAARDAIVRTITRSGISGWEVAAIVAVANGLQVLIGMLAKRRRSR